MSLSSTGPDRHIPSSLCVQQLGELPLALPSALALAMCWSAGCSAPLCCTRMVFTLAFHRGLLQAVWNLLFLLVYTLFGEGMAAFEMEFSSGEGAECVLCSVSFCLLVFMIKFVFMGCPAHVRNKLYFTACLCSRFAAQE